MTSGPTARRQKPLEGVLLKLTRAEKHLRDLDDEIGRYLESAPYDLLRYIQPSDPNKLVLALRVHHEPPPELSPVIGDCLQNMRAALEYLAWELVIANGGTPSADPPRTQFPIYTSSTTPKGNPKVVNIPPGIAPRALAVVESFQPYHRKRDPQAYPLAILDELSNRDKHRTLQLVVGAVKGPEVHLLDQSGKRILGGQFVPGVAYHDAVVAVFDVGEPFNQWALKNPGVDVEAQGAKLVALKEPGPWADQPVLVVLEELLKFVRDTLVPRFQPFLR